MFTATIQGGNLAEMAQQIKNVIASEQDKPIWVPSSMLRWRKQMWNMSVPGFQEHCSLESATLTAGEIFTVQYIVAVIHKSR